MTATPARNALLRGVPKYVTTHVAYGDFSKREAMTEAVKLLFDGTVPLEQVLAALVEAHGLDEVLRALGGYCGNCDGAGGCMSCRFREQHGYCEHDCPECGPEPWNERTREWTFPRPTKETTDVE